MYVAYSFLQQYWSCIGILFLERDNGEIVVSNASLSALFRAQKAFQNVAETTDLDNEYQVQAEIDKIRYNKDWWIESTSRQKRLPIDFPAALSIEDTYDKTIRQDCTLIDIYVGSSRGRFLLYTFHEAGYWFEQ